MTHRVIAPPRFLIIRVVIEELGIPAKYGFGTGAPSRAQIPRDIFTHILGPELTVDIGMGPVSGPEGRLGGALGRYRYQFFAPQFARLPQRRVPAQRLQIV